MNAKGNRTMHSACRKRLFFVIGMPLFCVAILNAQVVKALADPGVRQQLIDQGLTPRGSSAESLRSATVDQLARYARLIKQAGITTE